MATATLTEVVTLVLSKDEAEDLADYMHYAQAGVIISLRVALEGALKPPAPF